MHTSKYIFLLNSRVRAVACAYEEDKPNVTTKLTVYKTLDDSIQAGDLVIVPSNTRHKRTVVRVKEVGVDPGFDDPNPIDWIIDKVEEAPHKEILVAEEQLIAKARQADVERRRQELMKAHFGGASLADFGSNPLLQLEASKR